MKLNFIERFKNKRLKRQKNKQKKYYFCEKKKYFVKNCRSNNVMNRRKLNVLQTILVKKKFQENLENESKFFEFITNDKYY